MRVRSPQPERSRRCYGCTAPPCADGDGALAVTGMEAATVGELFHGKGIVLHELVARQPSLEEAFMTMTRSSVDYQPLPTVTTESART